MSERARAMQHSITRRGAGLQVTEWHNPHFGFCYTAARRLYGGRSLFQSIDMLRTQEFGRVLLLDNVTQVAERKDWMYHEPMVHPAMCCHPRPADVLVIGGGDGGALREVLKYRAVRRVVFAELDAEVVALSRRYLKTVNAGAFDDPRVEMVISDGRQYVERNPRRFDVVIMDMTDPFGPSRMLYTREFFGAVKRSFKDRRGVFVMHGESPVVRPHAYASVQKTLASVFRHVGTLYLYVQMYAMLWSIAVSSDTVNIARRPGPSIDARLRANGIRRLKVYSGATHHAMQVAFPYVEDLLRRTGRVVTDREPDFADNIHSSRR